MVSVELTTEDALLFTKFQKHFAFVQLMDKLGIFDLRDASVEIHFDQIGEIGVVKTHQNYRP